MADKKLEIEAEPGESNVADLGTKTLPRERFEMLRRMAGLETVPDRRAIAVEEIPGGTGPTCAAIRIGGSSGKLQQMAALVAAMLAESAAESNLAVAGSCGVPARHSPIGYGEGWVDRLAQVVGIVLILILFFAGLCVGRWTASKPSAAEAELLVEVRRLRREVQQSRAESDGCIPLSRRTVGCQAQLTYKRNFAVPRFQPLADSSHGLFG